jgi:hypothetical protein
MIPVPKTVGRDSTVTEISLKNLPDIPHPGKYCLLMSEQNGYSRVAPGQEAANPLFLADIQRTEWLVENKEVILAGKDAGKMQAFQFAPAEAEWIVIVFIGKSD